MNTQLAALVADCVLVLHFAVVVFITAGLLLVWVGAWRGWRWIRNPVFRYLHAAAIAVVALEAVLDQACPLTIWEDLLRGGLRPESFVGRWVRHALYYDAPAWVFGTLYVAWAIATAATLFFVPARRTAR